MADPIKTRTQRWTRRYPGQWYGGIARGLDHVHVQLSWRRSRPWGIGGGLWWEDEDLERVLAFEAGPVCVRVEIHLDRWIEREEAGRG